MSRVYFIKPIGMDGPIKIGCSISPDTRRRALATWSPFALEIVAEIDGDFDLERRFHALFAETHQRREWFGWSKRLAAVISAINDGSFDAATLPAPIFIANNGAKKAMAAAWTDSRRFQAAYSARMHALKKRGMPKMDECPFFTDGDYTLRKFGFVGRRDEFIRYCEDWADRMTAEYGHDGMKPVRWPRSSAAKHVA